MTKQYGNVYLVESWVEIHKTFKQNSEFFVASSCFHPVFSWNKALIWDFNSSHCQLFIISALGNDLTANNQDILRLKAGNTSLLVG